MAKKPSTDDRRRTEAAEIFAKIMRALHKSEVERAKESLTTLETDYPEFADIIERARTLSGRDPNAKLGRPKSPGEQLVAATIHLNRGDDDAARKDAEAVLSSTPKHAGAHYVLAVVAARKGDGAAALSSLKSAAQSSEDKRIQAGVDSEFDAIRSESAFESFVSA